LGRQLVADSSKQKREYRRQETVGRRVGRELNAERLVGVWDAGRF
jgi:hypothetical protein